MKAEHTKDTSGYADDDEDGDAAAKRRRVQRACDVCRRKKIRCDGAQEATGACSNCSNLGLECTFVDAAKKRTPPRSYVDAIEARMEKMEALLATLAPGVDFTAQIGPPVTLENAKEIAKAGEISFHGDQRREGSGGVGPYGGPLCGFGSRPPLAGDDRHPSRSSSGAWGSNSGAADDGGSESEDSEQEGLTYIVNAISKTALNGSAASNGPNENGSSARGASSSSANDSASDLLSASGATPSPGAGALHSGPRSRTFVLNKQRKDFAVGDPDSQTPGYTLNRAEPIRFFGNSSGVSMMHVIEKLSATLGAENAPAQEDISMMEEALEARGAEYDNMWRSPERRVDPGMDLMWPEPDLEAKLIDTYFAYVHPRYPLINEARFRQEHASRPELRENVEWACCALAIFSLAARHLTDPRLRQYGKGEGDSHEPGLKWYSIRVALGAHEVKERPTMSTIQTQLLDTIYLLGVPIGATVAWGLLSLAIRSLQGLGAHRRNTARRLNLHPCMAELVNRVWWVAYDLDREHAAGLGRPLMIHDEDFDIDEPLEIDDDILYDALLKGTVPVQPEGKPSKLAAFVASIRLQMIVGRALRTIYAIGKAKAMRGFGGWQWDQYIVSELDSALNQWLDTVPEHLHFNAADTDEVNLMNSAWIYTQYYTAQILVHRPFIPDLKSSSPLTFPSLAICTNAARSAGHIFDALQTRNLVHLVDNRVFLRAFAVSLVLLVIVLTARSSASAMSEVRKIIRFSRGTEGRKVWGGMLAETLLRLATLAESRARDAQNQVQRANKRQHSVDETELQQQRSEQASQRGQVPQMQPQQPFQSQPQQPQTQPAYQTQLAVPAHGLPHTQQARQPTLESVSHSPLRDSPGASPDQRYPTASSSPSISSSTQPLDNLPLSTVELASAFRSKQNSLSPDEAAQISQQQQQGQGAASGQTGLFGSEWAFSNPFVGGGPYQTAPVTSPSAPSASAPVLTSTLPSFAPESGFPVDPTKSPSVAMSAFLGPNAFATGRTPRQDRRASFFSFPFLHTPNAVTAEGGQQLELGQEAMLTPSLLASENSTIGTGGDAFNGLFAQGQLWGDFGPTDGTSFFQ